MKKHLVKIKSIKHITPDVLQIVTEKPPKYNFTPGQAPKLQLTNQVGRMKKDLSHLLPCLSMIFSNLPSKPIHRTKV